MTDDLVKRLEFLLHGEKCLRQDLQDTVEAHSKQQNKRIEKLEAALREIIDLSKGMSYLLGFTPADIARKALEGKDDRSI